MASLDASVIVDFYLAGKLALLEELFAGRLLMSDFVNQELIEANLQLTGVRTIALSSTEEWDFFRNLRHRKPGLGPWRTRCARRGALPRCDSRD